MKKLIFFVALCFLSIIFIGCTGTKAYDVSFNINGHGEQPNALVKITELPELPTLEEDGYRFDGWFLDEELSLEAKKGKIITESITVYAKWTQVFTVEFQLNGHGVQPSSLVKINQLPTLPVLVEDGYTFKGWYFDEEFTLKASEGDSINKNTILYAYWEEIIYTYDITFEANGHGATPQKLNVSAIPNTLPNLEENGYRFDGWFLDEALTEPVILGDSLNKDITLYAKWTQLFTIHFDNQGYGAEAEDIQNVLSIPEDLPELEEDGYTFEGWYFDEEYTQAVEGKEALTKDITLYAKWTKNNPDAQLEGFEFLIGLDETTRRNLSNDGYAQEGITDFTKYLNTSAYRKVSTPLEFLTALVDARVEYTNTWHEDTKTVEQTLIKDSSVHVIEITNDLNMGYFKLGAKEKATNLVTDFANKMNNLKAYLCMSDMLLENGISQIKIESTSNLLIYSKNGAKITHCGFKLTSDTNVVFRNLSFDELWQWEDAPISSSTNIGDYDWFGWAYFKIAFCGFIWIDHCTFGKSYDGQIDYSNPVYDANAGTAFRAPYGANGENGLHISWCKFNSGSDDEKGYLYQMMAKIEQEYQEGKNNYLYYNALRNANISFEEILYGIAIPQKKGFLCGDDAKFSGSYENADDYNFNLKLKISFANCIFKNIEDRLPKLRGGNAYLYNCLVDSSEYYEYRTILQSKNAKSVVSQINGWKCALVSQGIVCGNGGSVKAENTIFRGIETLLKHNDTKNVSPYVDGGFELTNCSYQKQKTGSIYTGSSSDANTQFISSIPSKLNTANFSWKTENNVPPFEITAIALENLEAILNDTTFG
ncbi:MAG: InlB B-repeat-containing protein, partial [Anaeroplasmataceae bacterium]|nr:InlB B-repeat-containing protein [Anaeroplasmataceae bacterium]